MENLGAPHRTKLARILCVNRTARSKIRTSPLLQCRIMIRIRRNARILAHYDGLTRYEQDQMQILAYVIAVSISLAIAMGHAKSGEPTLPQKPVWTDAPPPSKLKPGRLQRGPGGVIILDDQPREIRVCPRNSSEVGCNYRDIALALANTLPNDTIVLAPGLYYQAAIVTTPNITIRGEPGAHMTGVAAEGKAALVIKSSGVLIDGIECSNISVRDRNGACIRIEGANLTVRNVYFHDNEEGILGGVGGTVLIENSRIERNGHGGQAHGVYISQKVDTFIFRNNEVLSTKGKGHDLKSRAQRTTIENNVFAGLDGQNSRALDLPNGGMIVIRGNVFEKGPNSDNRDMIGLAREAPKNGFNAVNQTLLEGNTFIFDAPDGVVLRSVSTGEIIFRNNLVIGSRSIGATTTGGDNQFFDTRASGGLLPYPALPSIEHIVD